MKEFQSSLLMNESEAFEPNLMPLLDIIFILLVFLLLVASVPYSTITLDLPKGTDQNQSLQPQDNEWLLSISPDGLYQLEKQGKIWFESSDFHAFTAQDVFQDTTHNQKLIIAVDNQAPSKHLLQLLNFISTKPHLSSQILFDAPAI